jgi:hypothetical protein
MSDANPLLTNSTIQGAAKHIEGLLDSKGQITKPKEEATPVEAKEESKTIESKEEVVQEETEVQQTAEAQPEEIEEAEAEEEASEDLNAENEQELDLHQVIVNGEKIDVNLEELKAGYQKDADYRRKTEELAIEKRELKSKEDRLTKEYSTKIEELNNLSITLNAEINNELSSKELDELWDSDPTEAAKIDRKLRRKQETIQRNQAKLRQHQQEQFQKILMEEQKKVALKHPEFSDPIKGASLKTNMRNYLVERGFTDKEISGIYDSRMFDVVLEGMNYKNNANKAKPNFAKKIVKPSKVVKPGIKSTKDDKITQSRLEKLKSLKKSGSPRDATDLLKRYL